MQLLLTSFQFHSSPLNSLPAATSLPLLRTIIGSFKGDKAEKINKLKKNTTSTVYFPQCRLIKYFITFKQLLLWNPFSTRTSRIRAEGRKVAPDPQSMTPFFPDLVNSCPLPQLRELFEIFILSPFRILFNFLGFSFL